LLKAVVVSPDQELSARLVQVLGETGRVKVVRTSHQYLHGTEWERFLLAHAPQVIYLDPSDLFPAIEMMRTAQGVIKGVKVAATGHAVNQDVLLDLMRIGVREFLPYPFDEKSIAASLDRLESLIQREPTTLQASDSVYAFLPAKAGVGTSTVALNTAVALAVESTKRVLLADLDLNNGMLGFMLKMDSGYSIYEAAAHAASLDLEMWDQLVARSTVDLLPSGKLDPGSRLEASQLRDLVSFARRFYHSICLDLSGNMEKFSLEMLMESKAIFLVVTPEIPSIHMAQAKLELLREMDVLDRVELLVNRAQRNQTLSSPQIGQLLGLPVKWEFPNCYRDVHKSLTSGLPIEASSDAGKKFRRFAASLLSVESERKPVQQKKFLEYFSVSRYSPTGANR